MPKQAKIEARIIKAATPTQANVTPTAMGDDFISPPADLRGYKTLVNNSTILPQCIRAYKNNIAGFGIAVRYKHDEPETPEMKAEWDKITAVLEALNLDQDTKEVFEDVIEAREIYGIGYLEVMRNLAGEVVGIELIRQAPTLRKTAPLDPYVEVGERRKRFVKYRQEGGGRTVYFKEIGDPRVMDKRNGEYREGVPLEYQANEILEFAIGTEVYGEVRWIGQVLGSDGSRRAENLNNRYFSEGRHTPMMILVQGGTLTDDSFEKLREYVTGIKGEGGQHAFIVLEAAEDASKTVIDGDKPPSVQIVNMSSMLQRDELFQEYQDNHRSKVQSAFQLPDLYVGYTTDFNRATAISAQQITEQQVFRPERASLAWAVNNKLLADYGFKHVEAYFMEPEVTSVDDMTKLLNVAVRAGGVTPNKAKEIAYKALGGTAEPYEGDWGEIPLEARKLSMAVQSAKGILDDVPAIPSDEALDEALSLQIAKSVERNEQEITAVLKEIRALLTEVQKNDEKVFTFGAECGIIKTDDQPRDDKGRFASSDGGASGGGESVGSNNGGETGNNMTEAAGTAGGYSATGANPDIPEMTPAAQERHKKHLRDGKSYPGMSMDEYVRKSAELARSPVGGDIDGYKASDGSIVRYNQVTNDWVRAYNTGVATMFRPDLKETYFEKWLKLDKGVRNDD